MSRPAAFVGTAPATVAVLASPAFGNPDRVARGSARPAVDSPELLFATAVNRVLSQGLDRRRFPLRCQAYTQYRSTALAKKQASCQYEFAVTL